MKKRSSYILNTMKEMYPNARCELDYQDLYQLSISVILSAQTTDKRVNMVTPDLFKVYPDPKSLSNADVVDVETIIKSIGLYKNKARNIVLFAKDVTNRFNGLVPSNYGDLISLPGIGRKTANVILSEGFRIPRIAVDTHVERVSKRLRFASQDASILQVEEALMQEFDEQDWHQAHLAILFFGRYFCLAKNPNCDICPFYKKECIKK